MSWELTLLKPLVGPTVRILGALHPIRRIRTRASRGKSCFRFPPGKIYILIPERIQGSTTSVEANDMRAATEVGEMLLNLGYRRGKDWDFYIMHPAATLPHDIRRKNLISLCGPSANSFIRELLSDYPDIMSSMLHNESLDRNTRWFRWRNRVYQSHEKADFAYLTILPNPFNSTCQLVAMFGLRSIGTYGAALLYSGKEYKDVRKSLELHTTFKQKKLDVLLYVGRGDTPTGVSVVRTANLGDGLTEQVTTVKDQDSASTAGMFSAGEYLSRLQRIADAIHGYKRMFHFHKMVYTYTILDDFSQKMEEIETFSPVDDNLSIYWKYYLGNVPTVPIESLRFRAEMVAPLPGHDIVWLPAKNEPLRKEFLIFPLPPMRLNEPPRTIRFSTVWPGGAEPLKSPNGRDVFRVFIESNAMAPIACVEVNIEFEAPGTYLVQRVREGPTEISDASDQQECRINKPYRTQFSSVNGGTMFVFHVHRRS